MRRGSLPTLNTFLRGEIAAVETYRRALARMAECDEVDDLRACLASHERRVERLRDRVEDLGGVPAKLPAPEPMVFADGKDAGNEDTIARLEQGEDRGLKLYLDDVGKLDADSRLLVAREILPEQVRTHDFVAELADHKIRDAG
jgi:hypothetical protein